MAEQSEEKKNGGAVKEKIDPRFYMAAERTMLAWIRTALTFIVFGFVIVKFEFYIEVLLNVSKSPANLAFLGYMVIIMGLFALTFGFLNFVWTIRQLDKKGYHSNLHLYSIFWISIIVVTMLILIRLAHII